MKIIIDPGAGFCPGVQYSIQLAENLLQKQGRLYSLGSLIHNDSEINRLQQMGMKIIEHSALQDLKKPATILLRAHGEPPETYNQLKKSGLSLVDATCQIVHKSQNKVKSYCQQDYQIVFVGKKNHPEAVAMAGYCRNRLIVIEKAEDLIEVKHLLKTVVLAQTTISPKFFDSIIKEMRRQGINFIVENTICKYIKKRDQEINRLVINSEVVIVVGGKNSSNTAVLYKQCKELNQRSYLIQEPTDLQKEWFEKVQKIGITGGTSTPRWMLEKVRGEIEKLVSCRTTFD
jgi:4-hydroxy-3-methylbut-2-enyl diphosphate reductase